MRARWWSSRWWLLYAVAGLLGIVALGAALVATVHPFGVGQPARRQPDAGVAKLVHTGNLIANGSVRPAAISSPSFPPFYIPYLGGSPITDQKRTAATRAATLAQAPQIARGATLPVTAPAAELAQSFDGLNAQQDALLDGYEQDPPDQGLCANHAFVIEQVNTAMVIYRHDGGIETGPLSLNAFFGEQPREFTADQRCYYDIASQLWISTMVAVDPDGRHSYIELAVWSGLDPNASWTRYRLDTTNAGEPGCPCFLDNPRLAADAHGVYISGVSFNTSALDDQPAQLVSSDIYAIAKSQLLSGVPTPYFVRYGDLTASDATAGIIQPAATQQRAPAEYFLGSFYRYNATAAHVSVWALTHLDRLDNGGVPTLTTVDLPSEVYGYPPLAAQRDSAAPINTDDARMQDVVYHDGVLWTTLATVLHIAGESGNRAGAAWLAIAPEVADGRLVGARISGQGYLAVAGASLMHPTLTVNARGQGALVATLTGAAYYPSAVYTTFMANGAAPDFGTWHLAAAGVAPARIGTCLPVRGGACAWGDYSAAAYDAVDGSIWLATSYVAGPATPNENWATRVLRITPTPAPHA